MNKTLKTAIFSSAAFILAVSAFAHNGEDHTHNVAVSPRPSVSKSPAPSRSPKPSLSPRPSGSKDPRPLPILEKRNDMKEEMKEKREELKEKIETKRENLKERLENIRDQKKRESVERIDKKIDELNERMMNHFSKVLDQLENVLTRIKNRAAEKKVNIDTQITAAQNAINAAKRAVTDQSGKTYAIKITDEAKLKTDVGAAHKSLRSDINKVFELVKAAQKSVRDAAVALGRAVVTPTLTPSPTTPIPSATP